MWIDGVDALAGQAGERRSSSLKELRLRRSRSCGARCCAPISPPSPARSTTSAATPSGTTPSRDVLGAVVPVLVDPALSEPRRAAPRARVLPCPAAARASCAARRGGPRRSRPRRRPTSGSSPRRAPVALTLGERRALARRPTRAAFDALLPGPAPSWSSATCSPTRA